MERSRSRRSRPRRPATTSTTACRSTKRWTITAPAAIDAQRRFYQSFQDRVAAIDANSLDNEQRADLKIIGNNVGLAILEIDTIQNYKHNPTVYVELAGNALYNPFILNYAPVERRFQHIIQRLEKIPTLVEQAKANLLDSPEVWNRVAREENQGTST